MKKMHEQQSELKAKQELSECTFKPKLNKPKRRASDILASAHTKEKENESTLYTRNVNWKQNKAEK